MDKLSSKYPHIIKCLDGVETVVQTLRENPLAELEARFGILKQGRFVPGVDRQTIDRIIDMMQSSSHMSGDDDWCEEQDFYFSQNGIQCRTRVEYDSTNMHVQPTTIEKKLLASFDIETQGTLDAKMDIRISLKCEDKINNMDTCVNTSLVRIKQRRRFVTQCGIWAFDFAMIWSGRTKTDAELMQSKADPMFEIECEMIDAKKMLAIHSNRRIALSLLLKVFDLLPDGTFVLHPAF